MRISDWSSDVCSSDLLLFAAACSDLVDERYATWDEAAKAGTIERGLVPKFVPATASNIRSIHDLDDNGNRLTFELEPEAIDSMIASIAPLSKLRGDRKSTRLNSSH